MISKDVLLGYWFQGYDLWSSNIKRPMLYLLFLPQTNKLLHRAVHWISRYLLPSHQPLQEPLGDISDGYRHDRRPDMKQFSHDQLPSDVISNAPPGILDSLCLLMVF